MFIPSITPVLRAGISQWVAGHSNVRPSLPNGRQKKTSVVDCVAACSVSQGEHRSTSPVATESMTSHANFPKLSFSSRNVSSRKATLGTFGQKKTIILKDMHNGTVNAHLLNTWRSALALDCPMILEEWETVNATLLWINLKSGVLPLGSEVCGSCGNSLQRRGNVPLPASTRRIPLVRVSPRSTRTQGGARRLFQEIRSAGSLSRFAFCRVFG